METTLGLDSSEDYISVAVTKSERLLASSIFFAPMAALRDLLPAIDHSLRLANITISDIDLVAVTTGPGSWTGLRIGVETAKTISQVREIPVVGISTLHALAANARLTSRPVASIMDARKGQIFVELFDCSERLPKLIKGPWRLFKHELSMQIPPGTIIIGDTKRMDFNGELQGYVIGPEEWNIVHASTLCLLGERKFLESGPDSTLAIAPNYLQGSGADESVTFE